MFDPKKRRSSFVRFGFVLTILAFSALLTACAAPTGDNTTGGQVAATQAPAATEAPGSTEAAPTTGATTAPVQEATTAPTEVPATSAEPTTAPEPTMPPAATEATTASSVSFSNDVMPIFEKSCIKCHGGEDGEKGELNLTTHANVLAGGEEGGDVIAGDAANSLLYQLINNGKMPKRGTKLPQEQIDLIAKWIDEGAQDN